MKKVILVILGVCIIIVWILNTNIDLSNIKMFVAPNNDQIHREAFEVEDNDYYNLFITMLYPYVNLATDDYYKDFMTYLPHEAPYSYKIINIKKTLGRNYSYEVQLEVQPYVGPHLSVGRDKITFNIDLEGVKVNSFEHIESYDLPPHYQDILKKP